MTASLLHRELEIEKALLAIEARKSLLAFTLFTKPDYKVNWHHRYVCNIIDKFERGEIKKLMITQPPQTGKSELSSRRFPAYALGRNPNRKIALCSYAAEFVQAFNRDVQRIIDGQKYNYLYPETTLNSSHVATTSKGAYKRTANIFEVVGHRGFLKTVGVGGPLTGTTVDIGIIDDPFKDRQEANSQTIREVRWNWYTDVFESRLHNESQQLMLLTRWHEDDIAGRVLERDGGIKDGGEWYVVSLPAIKEDNEDKNDPRKIGEALWPERHSLERMLKIKEQSPLTFSSLYQQRPAPAEGNIIKREYFTIADINNVPDEVRTSVKNFVADMAYTEKKENDPSACTPYVEYNNKVYLFDYLNVRKEFSALINRLKSYIKEWGKLNSALYVEAKASGLSVIQFLKGHTNINAIPYNLPKGDKIVRLHGVEPFLEAKKVVLIKGAWNEAFITECLVFPNGKHDEAVDLLTMILNIAFMKPKPQKRKIRKIKLG